MAVREPAAEETIWGQGSIRNLCAPVKDELADGDQEQACPDGRQEEQPTRDNEQAEDLVFHDYTEFCRFSPIPALPSSPRSPFSLPYEGKAGGNLLLVSAEPLTG
jgi:hypothetical protein